MTAKRPESASVALTRTIVVPRFTLSNTGSFKQGKHFAERSSKNSLAIILNWQLG